MNLTDYHAKLFAYELARRCSADRAEKLAGALLADEVGLGKTIEAELVLSKKWAEGLF